jgi:hypothetical protein
MGALSKNSQEFWIKDADHSTLIHNQLYARQTVDVIIELLDIVQMER